jgi:hypothetical protein
MHHELIIGVWHSAHYADTALKSAWFSFSTTFMASSIKNCRLLLLNPEGEELADSLTARSPTLKLSPEAEPPVILHAQ